ncbi:MAG: TolC family protein [Flammeovirgaceae bacterium]
MFYTKHTFIFLLTCFVTQCAFAQTYTLEQVIALAKDNSIRAKQAENRKENRFWQYKTFQSDYKPQLSLGGTLPGFNRSFSPVTQPDGTILFQPISINNSDLNLSLSQSLAATGGEIFINSSLARFDDFDGDTKSYNATPIQVGFRQPLFAFNSLKWQKKIEPIRFEESQKQYKEEMEQVSVRASELFFDLLLAQISLNLAELNQSNNDTIYRIAKGRYSLGKIAENDLLQLELNLIRSEQNVIQSKLDLETSTLNLRNFIGVEGTGIIQLIEPKVVPEFLVDPELALEQAKKNRQQYQAFQRQRLEAEREVARAKGERFNVNLFGSFGLTQSSAELSDLYQNPQDQQNVQIRFQVPVMDWGRQKARMKTALANQDLVNSTIKQSEITFEQEIYVKAKQLPILKAQLLASIKADEVGQRRYNIAQKRYLVSKISITDLNIALQEKDQAKINYLQSMLNFWRAYYEMRMLTMYDFVKNAEIQYE